jgi:DNA-binding beta-propeller fold protein YncE
MSVVVTRTDLVVVLRRAHYPVLLFSRAGDPLGHWAPDVVRTWGTDFDEGAHGLHYSQETDGEYLYFTDAAQHFVAKCTLAGQQVWMLGQPGQVGAAGAPFNQPTDVVAAPEGDFYVADGYGNSCVHHFDRDCKLIHSWGGPGTGPGQFDIVHDVWIDTRGSQRRLWVCDRGNNRLQVFTPEGQFLEEIGGFREPDSMWVDPAGNMYVTELLGRLTILDRNNQIIARIGGDQSREPGQLMFPHGQWGDSHGDIYIAECQKGARVQKFVRA